MPAAELLLAERCTRPWRVFHETYTICALLDISGGTTEWTYRGKVHTGHARDLMLMEPGEVHANTRANPPCDFRVLLLPAGLVEAAAGELGMRGPRPQWKSGHAADPAVFAAAARLHASLESLSSGLERQSRLVTYVRALLERCSETGAPATTRSERAALLRARAYIWEHASRRFTLTQLEAACGLSRFHLVRAFTKTFGLPPHAYKLRVQIARARELLASATPLAVVAAETGFSDQSHLGRHFKAVYGVTPGEYQRGGC